MMEMYNRWFHFEIKGRLEKIKDHSDRLSFLFLKKSKFISQNKGIDANQIILMFDNLIDSEKIQYELKNGVNQKPETVFDCRHLHKELNSYFLKYETTNDSLPNNKVSNTVKTLFNQLYKKSLSENYFWQYCPFNVFKYYIENELQEFKKNKFDKPLVDFYFEQLELLFKNTERDNRNIYLRNNLKHKLFDKDELYYFKILPSKHDSFSVSLPLVLDEEYKTNIENTQNRKIEFLLEKLEELTNIKNSNQINSNKTEDITQGTINNSSKVNPNQRIFKSANAFELFEHWRSSVKEKTKLAEYSFIFWQMQKDSLIYEDIKPTVFRNWLLKTFDIELGELKQLRNCDGGNKYSRYQTAKLLFQC